MAWSDSGISQVGWAHNKSDVTDPIPKLARDLFTRNNGGSGKSDARTQGQYASFGDEAGVQNGS